MCDAPAEFLALSASATASAASPLALNNVGRAQLGGAEIAAFDPKSDRAFVTDAAANALHIVDLADPAAPQKVATVDLSRYGAGPNSVAVSPINGVLVAVAVEASPKTSPGSVVLFDRDGKPRAKPISTGALPDMLTFTPDGRTLLVANEGEPNDLYTTDPEGSVTVIDFDRGLGNPRVRTAGFTGISLEGPVRLFGYNNPTAAQVLEPEYIVTDGCKAWVTLQENNAIGLLDVSSATFSKVKALGFKDHGPAANGLDASDRDNGLGSTLPASGNLLVDRIFARPGGKACTSQTRSRRSARAVRRCSSAPTKETPASTRPPTSSAKPARAPCSARRSAWATSRAPDTRSAGR